MTTPPKAGRSRIPELANIPWEGPAAVTAYSRAGRDLSRDLGNEFEMAAGELYEHLSRAYSGNALLALIGAPDMKLKARRVVKRLKRAAELERGAARELVAFHAQFRKEFVELLQPPKAQRKSTFDWSKE
ncbi:hypothetical protein [Acrocarpospora sp. B8E8]|uniref:hypothetical protein n=1 Tax=Acrocarpospora sp. B8E8 TaxID=3153572 RepID=UPI00325DC625